ncbi:MAG TPA: DNA-binding response regulator [Ruminococcus sp.]|nr:DNA-binding response regulator [Ruminococcus sp.]
MAIGNILIVDDDRHICELLRTIVEGDGYAAMTANDGAAALRLFEEKHPDVILLDVMMPGMDGLQVLRRIREKSKVPVLIISAKSDPIDEAMALKLGADDFIHKPFNKTVVLARIEARTRQNDPMPTVPSKRRVEYDGLVVDLDGYVLRVKGQRIETPPKELQLLYCLASNPNHVYTRDQLLDEVWGFEYYGDSRTIDVHIKRLREKLDGVSDKWQLRTVWGVGYKFAVPEESE